MRRVITLGAVRNQRHNYPILRMGGIFNYPLCVFGGTQRLEGGQQLKRDLGLRFQNDLAHISCAVMILTFDLIARANWPGFPEPQSEALTTTHYRLVVWHSR